MIDDQDRYEWANVCTSSPGFSRTKGCKTAVVVVVVVCMHHTCAHFVGNISWPCNLHCSELQKNNRWLTLQLEERKFNPDRYQVYFWLFSVFLFAVCLQLWFLRETKVVVSESQHNGRMAHSIMSLVVGEERIRPLGDFPWLQSLHWISISALRHHDCFDQRRASTHTDICLTAFIPGQPG